MDDFGYEAEAIATERLDADLAQAEMDARGPRVRRRGWTFGECVGSQDWLTVVGSFYQAPELHSTRAEAETALSASPLRTNPHLDLVVRHVTQVDRCAFKITQPQSA